MSPPDECPRPVAARVRLEMVPDLIESVTDVPDSVSRG